MLKDIKLFDCILFDGRAEIGLIFLFDNKQIDILGDRLNNKKYFKSVVSYGNEKQELSFSDLYYSGIGGEASCVVVMRGEFSELSFEVAVYVLDVLIKSIKFVVVESNNLIVDGVDKRTEHRDEFLQKTAVVTDILNYNSDKIKDFPELMVRPMWDLLVKQGCPKIDVRLDKKEDSVYFVDIFIKKFNYSVEEVLTLFDFIGIDFLFYKTKNYFETVKQKYCSFSERQDEFLGLAQEVEDRYLGPCFKIPVSFEVDLSGCVGSKYIILSLDYFLKTDALVGVIDVIIQNINGAMKICSMIEAERGVGLHTRMINFDVADKYLESYNKYIEDAKKDLIFVSKMLNFYQDLNIAFMFGGLVFGRQTFDKVENNLYALDDHMRSLRFVLQDFAIENLNAKNVESEEFVSIDE